MNRISTGLLVTGLLIVSAAASALTVLQPVTPQNLKQYKFKLTSKVDGNNVDFVIVRDVHKIDDPARSAYLSNSKVDQKGLGVPVKLDEKGKTFTFRFSVPEDKVTDSVFTLWGGGTVGEPTTYVLNLRDFWKPKKD